MPSVAVNQSDLLTPLQSWEVRLPGLFLRISTSPGSFSQRRLVMEMDYWTSGKARQVDLDNVGINKTEKVRRLAIGAGPALLTLFLFRSLRHCHVPALEMCAPCCPRFGSGSRRGGGVPSWPPNYELFYNIAHLTDLNIWSVCACHCLVFFRHQPQNLSLAFLHLRLGYDLSYRCEAGRFSFGFML